ncbi:HNH endonuclease [Sphingomonas sp. CFBP 13714]|uniref:HNH endonuclease n=1 Tax=Sphingomonas sp. CFBP 13714 TaxID=2775308 RepID=UPI00177C96A3|nr:HNH endonuclease signature motif containing protein [Sphingomonas sp. CFBP 13714]MBD8699019.1 HNH endonuclease [Sphingomonas sp. CFBP 13714]
MAKQQLNAITREAIWKAHGGRCFYCDHPVRFADIEIDHFIAESTSVGELERLIEAGVLPHGFDILGHENLVPACSRHNCEKHDLQFTDRFIALQIVRIEKAAKKVRRDLSHTRKLYKLDQILRHLQKGIDDGSFSPEEALDYMRKLDRAPSMSEFMNTAVPPEGPQLMFTDRAITHMRQQGLSLERLAYALQAAARSRGLRIRSTDDQGNLFEVRLDQSHRLIYRQAGEYLIVEALERHR